MSVSIELSPNNILSIHMQGGMDKAELRQVFAEFKQRLSEVPRLRIYLEISDFDFKQIPLEVYLEDLKLWLKNPELLTRIDKAALITDEAWIKALFELECALIPGLQGKNFEHDQKLTARSWLSKTSVSPQGLSSRWGLQWPEHFQFSWPQIMLYASSKSLAGFALGLWLANLLAPKRRKQMGLVAIVLGLAAGLSVARQIIRQFSKPAD